MRRNQVAIVGFIILIAIAWQAISFLTHGRIIVSTDSTSATIYIKRDGSDGFVKTGHARISLTLKAGRYIVSVQGSSIASTQVVNLKGRQTLNLRINPANASGVEPVSDHNVSDIAADSQDLSALDPISGILYRISSSNTLSSLPTNQIFRSVQWISPLRGVAQDTMGRLYLVDQSTVSPLNVPFNYTQTGPINYAVTAGGSIYFSSGSTVYKGDATGFKKIYTASAPPSLLAAQNGSLAVVEELEGNSGRDNSKISIIAGGTVSVKPTGSFVAAWSPSGHYLAISGRDGGEVIDAKAKHVAALPHSNLSSPVWLDESTLIYAVSDQLWSYNIQTQQGRLVANMPLGGAISGIALTADKSYLYLVVRSITDGSRTEIKRVGLKGQAVDKAVYQLQDVTPQNVSLCFLDLVNFTKPTITVSPGTSTCLQAAQTKLQQSGFNLSSLNISPAPE